jgi:phosphatidylinositol-3,4,5-trisphosphate 3-phosphatase/dual-specificity protein phosphatase PTEN
VFSGFIICCWLLYNRMFPNYDPSLALRYYAIKRTKNQKGVTIPSQIRYVYYFARYLRWERGLARFPTIPARNPVLLQTIRLLGIPRATTGKDVWFKLVQNDGSKFSSKGKASLERRLAEDYLLFQARDASGQGITSLNDDCNLTFYMGGLFDTTKLFQFWFNTRMIGNVMDPTKENNEAEIVRKQERQRGTHAHARPRGAGDFNRDRPT